MQSHDAIGDRVYKTTFSDGTSIITNYGDSSYKYHDQTVPSMGYTVVPKRI